MQTQNQFADPPTLAQLEAQAQDLCNQIQISPNSPQLRLEAREAFYTKYGFYPSVPFGYGRSEIDFMKWEVNRGVLNSMSFSKPGSNWWRDVNITFIYYSTLGALIFESGQTYQDVPLPAAAWLNYIQNPGPKTWYIAHNTSIAMGYISCVTDATQETQYEQIFMNEVLSRLFYAQAMVEGQKYAFGELGELFANPLLPSIDLMVHLPDFYPNNYPLSAKDIQHVIHQGTGIEMDLDRLLDEILISPNLTSMYSFIANLLSIPELNSFVSEGKMVYPNISSQVAAQASSQKIAFNK